MDGRGRQKPKNAKIQEFQVNLRWFFGKNKTKNQTKSKTTKQIKNPTCYFSYYLMSSKRIFSNIPPFGVWVGPSKLALCTPQHRGNLSLYLNFWLLPGSCTQGLGAFSAFSSKLCGERRRAGAEVQNRYQTIHVCSWEKKPSHFSCSWLLLLLRTELKHGRVLKISRQLYGVFRLSSQVHWREMRRKSPLSEDSSRIGLRLRIESLSFVIRQISGGLKVLCIVTNSSSEFQGLSWTHSLHYRSSSLQFIGSPRTF